MYPALVVLWLATPPEPATLPREVTLWAAQRGYRAVSVTLTPEPAYAAETAQEIERLLEEARRPTPDAAPLERLEQLLAQHPELPQAAWWLAERYALERPHARDTAASRLELARAALEGPRAETAGAGAVAPVAPVPPLPLEVLGLRPRDRLVLDGEPWSSGAAVVPGRHHAQRFRAQRRIWAGWLEIDSARLQLPEPTTPCTDLDLLGTESAADAPHPAPGVRCPAWAVAQKRSGHIELALCHLDRCEPWQPRSSAATASSAGGAAGEPPAALPAWLTWGALGLGAAASTALVLWQAGVFDRAAPATEFVFTGPSAGAVHF